MDRAKSSHKVEKRPLGSFAWILLGPGAFLAGVVLALSEKIILTVELRVCVDGGPPDCGSAGEGEGGLAVCRNTSSRGEPARG